MITINDTIPNVDLYIFDHTEKIACRIKAHKLLQGRVILVGVPGAFTKTCSTIHIPGFIKYSTQFKLLFNVDLMCCIAINDPYVMHSWGELHCPAEIMQFVSDGNGEFTKALGLTPDLNHLGMNIRSKRYSMLIEDYIVKVLSVDDRGKGCVLSEAEHFYQQVTLYRNKTKQ